MTLLRISIQVRRYEFAMVSVPERLVVASRSTSRKDSAEEVLRICSLFAAVLKSTFVRFVDVHIRLLRFWSTVSNLDNESALEVTITIVDSWWESYRVICVRSLFARWRIGARNNRRVLDKCVIVDRECVCVEVSYKTKLLIVYKCWVCIKINVAFENFPGWIGRHRRTDKRET